MAKGSIVGQLDELGTILVQMVAEQGIESPLAAEKRLERIDEIVRRNWPEKLREAKQLLETRRTKHD